MWRPVLATVLLLAGVGCGGGLGGPIDGGAGSGGASNRWTGTLDPSINRNVDILFLIDDSSSMKLSQDNLLRNISTFVTRLQDPPGLPNVHIAVVSSDMGAGDGTIASCDSTGGKQGIFQYTARGACTSSGLQAGATYISDVGGLRNYTGRLEDVFTCIAALGETGCGFEHQFAAILRALGADGRPIPLENQGFLRPDAYLAIVMLTNEDDCSATPGVPLFDTGSNFNLLSQLGPPVSFRCNEFGHICDGMKPNRNAPGNNVASMVTYASCTSNESDGYVLEVADTAARLRALKPDPSQVAVISIQGPATPYTVTWRNPSTADTTCGATSCPWPAIGHVCTGNDGSFADPGVRTAQLAGEFGAHGLVLPICSDNLAPSLDRAGMLINSLFGPGCIAGGIGTDPQTGQPDCHLTQRMGTGTGMLVEKDLPPCLQSGGAGPCWTLEYEPTCSGRIFVITPDPTVGPSTAVSIKYDCAKCAPMDPTRTCY